MDAIEFIKERDRMYEVAGYAPSLIYKHEKSAKEIVREVEEWSAAHSRKTRQSVFLKQYPNAKVTTDGTVEIWPCNMAKNMQNVINCNRQSCSDCRREFWMQEVE